MRSKNTERTRASSWTSWARAALRRSERLWICACCSRSRCSEASSAAFRVASWLLSAAICCSSSAASAWALSESSVMPSSSASAMSSLRLAALRSSCSAAARSRSSVSDDSRRRMLAESC